MMYLQHIAGYYSNDSRMRRFYSCAEISLPLTFAAIARIYPGRNDEYPAGHGNVNKLTCNSDRQK